jgi:hypothetical protein
MIIKREFALLNRLQTDLAIRRDWIAVGHLQALIDHMAETQMVVLDNSSSNGIEPVVH